MAQQGPIMKTGLSYAVVMALGASGSQVLSVGCRYIRVTANAPLVYALGNSVVSPTTTNGIYAPGTTFGPDILDTEGRTTVNAFAGLGTAAILYITELSA